MESSAKFQVWMTIMESGWIESMALISMTWVWQAMGTASGSGCKEAYR